MILNEGEGTASGPKILMLRLCKTMLKKTGGFVLLGVTCLPAGLPAQQQDGYFPPLLEGDGIRYPLVLSPAVWEVLGPLAVTPGTDGLVHMAYVIRLENHSMSQMAIQSVELVNPYDDNRRIGTNQVLTTKNEDVTGEVLPFRPQRDEEGLTDTSPAPVQLDRAAYSHVLSAGTSGAVYMDVTFHSKSEVPAYVSHRITVSQLDKNGADHSVVTVDAPIRVDRRDPISLSPPLRGPRWFDGDSCCKQIGGHRWALSPVNGRITAAETFAIDFVQLLENNRIFQGPIDQLSSYAFYGANVYNASAGTVVEVVRDLPDEKPGMDPENITAANAAGNHVIVAMEGGRFALYAHLIPFSITVNVGDFIHTGCILGKLGNSGSSSIPHLHFQVMDSPSSLAAHGLPFVFDRMSRDYRYAGSLDDLVRQTVSGEPLSLMPVTGQTQFQNTMSLIFDVVNFR